MNPTIQLARFVVGLSWIYHGLFPKLIQIAPIEFAMSSSIGLSLDNTHTLIKLAGVGEILFGIAFMVLYRNRMVVIANIAALTGLLVFVAVLTPVYLIEAFNPVTTNVPLIALSLILLNQLGDVKH